MKALTPKMHAEITAVVSAARKTKSLVRVYAEAERIRQANLEENIALEDIVNELMELSAHGPGFESDPSDARSALMGKGNSTAGATNDLSVSPRQPPEKAGAKNGQISTVAEMLHALE